MTPDEKKQQAYAIIEEQVRKARNAPKVNMFDLMKPIKQSIKEYGEAMYDDGYGMCQDLNGLDGPSS